MRNARVHLTLPEEALFAEEKKEPSASVVLELAMPGTLSKAQVNGVLHLLVTAVEGLKKSNISVVDTQLNVLAAPTDDVDSAAGLADTQLEALRKYNKYLEDKVRLALQSVLGSRRCVVTVNADLDFDEIRTEKVSYPAEGILRKEEMSTETTTTTQALPRGPVGATAGVPPGAGAATGSTSTDKESRETSSEFEVPETYESTRKAPGTVEKLVVFAGIEGRYRTDEGEEKTYVPLEDAEIETFRGLVLAAVGLDEARGDSITVSDMPFEEVAIEMDVPGLPWYSGLPVAQIALAVVALLAFLMLRSTLSKMVTAPSVSVPEVAPVEEYEVSEQAALKERVKEEITRLSREQPDTVASVLRTWLVEE